MSAQRGMLAFDEEVGRTLEAAYRTPEMIARRAAACEAVQPRLGERGLDIGPGPGFLACELAQQVGDTGRIDAVDRNPAMLALTERRARQLGLAERVFVHGGDAAALPFPDDGFDFAVAVQVYEYVPAIERALAEARRVLRPGGRLAVIDTDWDTLAIHTDDSELAGRIFRAWDEHLAHRRLPPRLPGLLRRAGFDLEAVALVPVVSVAYSPDTFGRVLIDLIANFARGRESVAEADVDAWLADIARQSERGSYFFSLGQHLFLARAASGL